MGINYRKDTNKYEVRIRNKKLGIDYSKSFSSKTLAKKDEIRVLAEIENGTFLKQNENMTFKEASELYMKNISELRCKQSTIEGYYAYLNNHIYKYFGDKKLCTITKLECDSFITTLKNTYCKSVIRGKDSLKNRELTKTLSNGTINHMIILCNAIFEYMVDCEVIAKNPMRKIKKLKSDRKEAHFLNVEECQKLLDVAENNYSYYYPIILLSIITGMRQGEVLALTWNDIDFKNNIIKINKTYSHGKISTPKTQSSIRTIIIPDNLAKVLKEQWLKVPKTELNLVFPSPTGNYLDCRNLVNRVLKPCLKEAGVKDITWHQLRHSCITALAENKIPIKSIQKQAGHSSELTTLKFYNHVTEEMEKEVVNVLGRVFAR